MRKTNREKREFHKRLYRGIFVFLISFLVFGKAFTQIPPPPNPPKLVNDFEDILSGAEEASLERKLIAYDDSTSTQIIVVTSADLGGHDISEFAIEIGDQWGVGQGGKDNGLVIAVSDSQRKAFIATGWGVEGSITDVTAKRIIDRYFIPHFRTGNYYAGIDAGTDVMIQILSGEFDQEQLKSKEDEFDFSTLIWILILIIIIYTVFRRGGGGGRGGHFDRRGYGGPIIIGGGGFGSSGGGGFGGGGFGGFGGGGFGGGGAGGSW